MIKLGEKHTLKAKAGGKPGFLYQLAKSWMQQKSAGRKLKVLLQRIYERLESKTGLLLMWKKFVCIGYQTSHNIPLSQS